VVDRIDRIDRIQRESMRERERVTASGKTLESLETSRLSLFINPVYPVNPV
jgi:hypothetical protein